MKKKKIQLKLEKKTTISKYSKQNSAHFVYVMIFKTYVDFYYKSNNDLMEFFIHET